MKKQPEIHSRAKYYEAIYGVKKEKDRSRARKRKKRK